jgi:hypothetical protein
MLTCDPSTQEAEAKGSPLQGQPGLHSETLLKKNTPRPQIVIEGIIRHSLSFFLPRCTAGVVAWPLIQTLPPIPKCHIRCPLSFRIFMGENAEQTGRPLLPGKWKEISTPA